MPGGSYDVPEEAGQLVVCTTVIQPGRVGREFFMTKGHFHAKRATGEVYLGLRGQGTLLLDVDGDSCRQDVSSGTVAYVPPGWAHRTANTGTDPFVFLAVYPADAGHDYGADPAPLKVPRERRKRVIGTCRNFAVPSCALLRHRGVAALKSLDELAGAA